MPKINAFIEGGTSDPEIVITVGGVDGDEGLTRIQIDRPGWSTLADLLLDEFQVGKLIEALQRRAYSVSENV